MTTYDAARRQLQLRIVYDGASGAGKTTNVRRLGALFASEPVVDASDDELFGRTLSFDWTSFRAGAFRDLPVVATVLGTPGARGFEGRRRHLLADADAIVFVCEATRAGLARARSALGPLRVARGERAVPLLVQVNRRAGQDGPTAHEVTEALGVPAAMAREADAREGRGVVDCFLAALQAVLASLEIEPPSVRAAPAPTPTSLAAALARVPLETDAAAETLLGALARELAGARSA